MSSPSNYWLSKSGAEYQAQQQMRSAAGNTSYAAQEAWLLQYLSDRARERPIKVLDFGCGFGRFARLLAGAEGVEYFGYDISGAMVADLLEDPPAGLQPVGQRVRVAADVTQAFPGERFDVVFTVSVLIHNSPEDARRLLLQMRDLLAPDGRIVLVENALSALSVRENSWHAGCWLHDVAGVLAPEFDIDIHPDAIPDHGAYVLLPAREGARALTLVSAAQPARPVTVDELRLAGLKRTAIGLQGLEAELRAHAGSAAGAHDEREFLHEEVNRLRLQCEANAGLAEQVESLHSELVFRQQLRGVLREARGDLVAKAPPTGAPGKGRLRAEESAPFLFDAPTDLRFANHDDRFGPAAQVFHKEWFGIRAACGSLPGTKLAISSIHALSAGQLEEIIETCRSRGIDRMVLHGMSDSMYTFAHAMHRAGIRQYVAWHGAATMWLHEAERKYFELAAGLLDKGVIQRLHTIRRGTDAVLGGRSTYPKQLLNPVPNVRIVRAAPRRSESAIAFSPSWNLLHKNLATNLAAAAAAKRVGTIWAMAPDAVMVGHANKKLQRLPAQGQYEIMQTMSCADIVLNVSIVDCHPMVDLEALAAGTPCLRGRLFLDALEDHPYVHATEVENMLSVADVAASADRVLGTPATEMDAMMRDYAAAITQLSMDRYAEFLELQ